MPASNILNRTRRAMRDRSQLHKRPLVGIPFSVTVAHTNEAMGDKWSCSQAVSNRMKNVEKASAAKVKGDKANDAKNLAIRLTAVTMSDARENEDPESEQSFVRL